MRCVSCSSKSDLPAGRAPGCHGSYSPMWIACHKHKEKPSDLSVQLGSYVPNAHVHVSKAPDPIVIMCL
jgi:hypothetical protein